MLPAVISYPRIVEKTLSAKHMNTIKNLQAHMNNTLSNLGTFNMLQIGGGVRFESVWVRFDGNFWCWCCCWICVGRFEWLVRFWDLGGNCVVGDCVFWIYTPRTFYSIYIYIYIEIEFVLETYRSPFGSHKLCHWNVNDPLGSLHANLHQKLRFFFYNKLY